MLITHKGFLRAADDGAGAGGAGAGAGGAGAGAGTGTGTGTGTGAPPVAFADQLPEDIRADPVFKDFKDLSGLARSYRDTAKMVGMDKSRLVALPGDKATPEEINAFREKLGWPKQIDGYKLPTDLPPIPGLMADENLKKGYLEAAHKAGLSTKQAEDLFRWYHGASDNISKTYAENIARAQQQGTEALQKEWGAKFDENLALAKRAVGAYADEDMQAVLEDTRLGDDPRVIKFFAKLGENLKEDGLKGGRTGTGNMPGALSPTEAQQQVASKYSDVEFMKAYNDKNHMGHANAVAEMERLFKYAYPEPRR